HEQIVVCESGKFSNVVVSDFDMALTQKTQAPEMSLLEKQCSGAYLANCALEVLKSAASENLFSSDACSKINSLKSFSLKDTDEFLFSYYEQKQSELSPSELLQSKLVPSENLFSNICASKEDCDILFELLDAVMERSARNTASVLVACALQSGAGHDKDKPICITANGSTYYKTFKMSERIHSYLKEELTQKMNIHWEIISVEDDITLGSAIGAFAKE
ncbi:MAG: hexokinase, partial [Treponema sp.]|nr:hexokinase [Treponema sp.]